MLLMNDLQRAQKMLIPGIYQKTRASFRIDYMMDDFMLLSV